MKATNPNTILKANVGLLISALIIGLSFVFVKIAVAKSGALDLLAHRFTAAALALGLLHRFGVIHRPHFTREELIRLLKLSSLYPLLFFFLQAEGMIYTTAAEGGILSALTPIITLIMSMLILREKNSVGQIAGVVISLVGVVYIFLKNGTTMHTSSLWGNILIILSIFATVLYYIFGRRSLPNFKAIDVTFVMVLVGFVVFNLIAISNHLIEGTISGFFTPLGDRQFLLAVLYLGILSSLLTSVCNNYALSVVSATQVAVVNNLVPIISIIGGIWILDERLQYYHYIGGVMVIIGVLATNLWNGKK